MHPPVDYPIPDDECPTASVNTMTYAALKERYSTHQAITGAMIQSASVSMEMAHQFPTATKPRAFQPAPATPVFQRLIDVIK